MGNLSDIETKLDGIVNEATDFVDLVDKYAGIAGKFAGVVPGVGAGAAEVVALVDELDRVLHALKSALES